MGAPVRDQGGVSFFLIDWVGQVADMAQDHAFQDSNVGLRRVQRLVARQGHLEEGGGRQIKKGGENETPNI